MYRPYIAFWVVVVVAVVVVGVGLAIDAPPYRTASEKLPLILGQTPDCERSVGGKCGLTPSQALHHEPIKRIAKCTGRAGHGNHPTVHRAICSLDILRFTGSKLQQQQNSAIPAKDLGTLILVCVPPEFAAKSLLGLTQVTRLPLPAVDQISLHLANGHGGSLVANVDGIGTIHVFRNVDLAERLGMACLSDGWIS